MNMLAWFVMFMIMSFFVVVFVFNSALDVKKVNGKYKVNLWLPLFSTITLILCAIVMEISIVFITFID